MIQPSPFSAIPASDTVLHLPPQGVELRVHRRRPASRLVSALAGHHGHHTGNLMGIPPTGRDVAYQYVHFLRFHDDGKATEHWSVRDDMTLMRQLGVMPDRAAAGAAATS
ncbi:MAG: ester cyclase [Candidatus Limnocylindria bacterium]